MSTRIWNVSEGSKAIQILSNQQDKNVIVTLKTSSDWVGTTATATFQEGDGDDFDDVQDSSGSALEVTLAAASTRYRLKTNIFYEKGARINFAVGNASAGSVTITRVILKK